MTKFDEIVRAIREEGYKITGVRTDVIAFLLENKKPYTAQEIQKMLAGKGRKVNKTTVYRELEFLKKNGVIAEVKFGDRKVRYEIADLPHHHHMVCTDCETVEDVYVKNELKDIEKKIKQKTSFMITDHTLEFFGLCINCFNKNNK